MKKRLVAVLMASMLSVSLFAGCGKEVSDSEGVRTEQDSEEKSGEGSTTLSIDTKDFDKMMDAYKDYYNEFCEENLKPYYEDHSDCDCAARFVVNPDNNKVMMVIADIVDAAGDEMKVDLYFFEYKGGKVEEYLSISGIWTTTDGIYVGNILNGLYVSTTTYPDGGQYEHTQYRISDGKAEEITQSKADDEEWIDIETSNGVFEYPLPYNLSERIFTDCDSDANKYCVAERNFEDCIDYLKDNMPESVTGLKIIYGDFLIENRITSNPNTYVLLDDTFYFYVYSEYLRPQYPLEYNNNLDTLIPLIYRGFADAGYTGFFIPCVKNMSGQKFAESIDGYPVFQNDNIGDDNGGETNSRETAAEEGMTASEEVTVASDADSEILQKYQDYVNTNGVDVEYGCKFVDIDGDGTPELITDYGAQFQRLLYIDPSDYVCEEWGIRYYNPKDGTVVFMSESGTLHFSLIWEHLITEGFYIYVELGTSPDGGMAETYYYDGGGDENYYEISYDEYKGYIEDCENNYVSVSLSDAPSEITLEDAWEAYNN